MELAVFCFIQGAIKIYIMQRPRLFRKAKIQRQNNSSSMLLVDTEVLKKTSSLSRGGSCISSAFLPHHRCTEEHNPDLHPQHQARAGLGPRCPCAIQLGPQGHLAGVGDLGSFPEPAE